MNPTLDPAKPVTTRLTLKFDESDAPLLAALQDVIPYAAHPVQDLTDDRIHDGVAAGVLLNHHDTLATSGAHIIQKPGAYLLRLSLHGDVRLLDHLTENIKLVLAEHAPRARVILPYDNDNT